MELKLSSPVTKALAEMGYSELLPIQKKVIPLIQAGKDVCVQAKTGSGKTAAFAIPLIEKIDWDENSAQVLILCPTRELATQISREITLIGVYKKIRVVSLYGKEPFSYQQKQLSQKVHIIVGTPGRVLDHLERGTLDCSDIQCFILDEADEMLNMGFIDSIHEIREYLPKHQTCLFSATMNEKVEDLIHASMNQFTNVESDDTKVNSNIEHYFLFSDPSSKLETLKNLLVSEPIERAILFCQTQKDVQELYHELDDDGFSVQRIHGGMEQKDRFRVMNQFKQGEFRLLVATDVAARGIDVDDISHVIHTAFPTSNEVYIHRSGRSGRLDKAGKIISFLSKKQQRRLDEIEDEFSIRFQEYIMPSVKKKTLVFQKPEAIKNKKDKLSDSVTKLYIYGGKSKKIRRQDIVGSLCALDWMNAEDIGIIEILDHGSYVTLLNGKGSLISKNIKQLQIKGKSFKIEIANSPTE